MSPPPSKIGRYHIIGRIASGGMAEILLAKVLGPGGFERPVVIKRVLPHLVNKSEFRDMFLDEARIVASIHHSNVVQVHELGREDDELYLVMEYLAGESVRSVWKRGATRNIALDLGLCAHIVAEACAGLHAAHEFTAPDGKPLHVVHRDVCPNNLFVTYDGSVKVVDFGIAQADDRYTMTQAGQVKGKAPYMAPEQCLRRPIDCRTDIFALGVVLYELTTGHRLFGGALESRIMACLRREEVQPPSRVVPKYPADLERICMRALRFDPEERFASAEEMRRELVRFQRGRSPDVLPEEQLRACMHQLFQDRIAEKADLLNRLRSGSGVSHIPTAEVSDEVSVPIVETDREPDEMGPALQSGYDTTRGPRRGRKRGSRALILAALLLSCMVAGMTGLLLTAAPVHGKRHPLPAQTIQAATPQEPPQAAPTAAPMAAAPEQVVIDLTSQPPGAGVWIDEQYHGDTPVSVILPRAEEPAKLRLQLVGHDALEQTLVPNVDQRLSLSLVALPVPASSPDASVGESPSPSEKVSRKRRRPARQAAAREEFFLFE